MGIQRPPKLEKTKMLQKAAEAVSGGSNVVIVGSAGTGKRTFLADIQRCVGDKRVAFASTRAQSANELGGTLLASFLGMKPNMEATSLETAAASMSRHVRAMRSTFADCFPCLTTCDVLVIHGLEHVSPITLGALDVIAREERQEPSLAFGGLQIVAAADFWRKEVSPSSPLVGNLFQMKEWGQLFPTQLPLTRNFNHDLSTDKGASDRALRALFGTLTNDDLRALNALKDIPAEHADYRQLVDNRYGRFHWSPKFPQQPAVMGALNKKEAVRSTSFGQYLMTTLIPLSYPDANGLVRRLHFTVGDSVAFSHDMMQGDNVTVAKGSCGSVVGVTEHFITVVLDTRERERINVPRLRVSLYHPLVPSVSLQTTQFPLFQTKGLFPAMLIDCNLPVPRGVKWHVDARLLTNVNDLGNIMALLPTNHGVFRNIPEYLTREGFIHEPTRVYLEGLLLREDPAAAAVAGVDKLGKAERWCRNCKTHLSGDAFHAHWDTCVEHVRWCTDCSTTVPASKWDAHCEKHTVVMCLDCGQPLEWRYWEQHRRLCGPMLRELSADNENLPATTRVSNLESSIDRMDLHTVKAISRGSLPRRHTDVGSGSHVRRFSS
jgi:hypothetical protein